MKQQLQRQQARKASLKNLDLYAIILIGTVLSVLGLFNIASVQVVLSCTLATLAILSIGTLRNRKTNKAIEKRLEQLVRSLPEKIQVYQRQTDAYSYLEHNIKSHHVRDAVLIQYSCTNVMNVLQALLDSGATVTAYIQDEKIPMLLGSQKQVDRILHKCKFILGDLAGVINPGRLKLRKYHVPGSVSGIKINFGTEQLLCMGWYTYLHVDESNRNPAYPTDTVHSYGHNVAAIVAWKGTDEFDALDRTFSTLEQNYQKHSEEVPLL